MNLLPRNWYAAIALLGCISIGRGQSTAGNGGDGKADPAYGERLRPQFHFTAAKNWINDPNGMVFCDGIYHLFFQYNPSGRESANKAWGHAVSSDMIHWSEREPALYPDEMGEMWSGSGVVDAENTAGFQKGSDKPIVLIYTAAGGTTKASHGREFTQCLAYSSDNGRTWTKYDKNPVLQHVRGTNRDPKIIWHAPTRRWIMVVYLDGNDFGFFSSPDLKAWTHLQDITVPGSSECPDFFEMPIENEAGRTAWVWTSANAKYLVGEFDGREFRPEHGFAAIQSEFGRNYYAAQTFSNSPDGRRIQIGWMRDGQYPGMPFDQQLSFPTTLTLHRTADGLRLCRLPIAELQTLRDVAVAKSNIVIPAAGEKLETLAGDLLDMQIVIDVGSAAYVGLRARGQSITFDTNAKSLSCLGAVAPLNAIDGRITLRVLVDRTSIEVFANDGALSLCSCYLPDRRANAEAPTIFADGGEARIVSCEGFTLKSAWPVAAAPGAPNHTAGVPNRTPSE